MEFTQLSFDEYASFISSSSRALFPQLPQVVQLRRDEGMTVLTVGVKEGDTVRAAAAVQLQPWRKILHRARILYGPVLDSPEDDLARCFFTGLVKLLKKEHRTTVSLRVNSTLAARFYEDITPVRDNPAAEHFSQIMSELGFSHLAKEFGESVDIQVRFMYTKDIGGMSLDEVLASCKQSARNRFNKAGTPGLEIRMLTPEDFPLLERVLTHTSERTGMRDLSEHSIRFYRALLERDPENVFAPVAVLNCAEYLEPMRTELAELEDTVSRIDAEEAELTTQGKRLGKKRRGTRNVATDRLNSLRRRIDETERHRAELGDEIVLAGAYFIACPDEMVYVLSGAYRDLQSYGGTHLIHREMLRISTERGFSRYNMYGITGDLTENAADAGVLEFKRQFEGYVEELVGTYEYALRPTLARTTKAVN